MFTPQYVPMDFIDLSQKERILSLAAIGSLKKKYPGYTIKFRGRSTPTSTTIWFSIEKGTHLEWSRFTLIWAL